MKIKYFRIYNYKSIIDSGYCSLASDITLLAGKNESGKTAILQALRDFNTTVKTIPEDAIPLELNDRKKYFSELCFDIEEIDEIENILGFKISNNIKKEIKNNGFTFFKDYSGNYLISKPFSELIDQEIVLSENKFISEIGKIFEKIKKTNFFVGISLPTERKYNSKLHDEIKKTIDLLDNAISSLSDEKADEYLTLINGLRDEIDQISLFKDLKINLIETIKKLIPNFIYYDDFSTIIKHKISLQDAKNNLGVKDFIKVADIDIDFLITHSDELTRKNYLKRKSATISGDFQNYWKQDSIKLIADTDSNNLLILIEEESITSSFKLEHRSKGLQWFLTFYLKLLAENTTNNIILIDEPGLYLHAKAQNDILKVLEKLSEKTQIIFSTHSPYLIDVNRLDRIRLVIKNSQGTKIKKIQNTTDPETLTPIITAIGCNIFNNLNLNSKNHIITEGISDYYYFNAIKNILKKQFHQELTIIPCTGASRIENIVSLFIGWDLEFVIVLDNDSAGRAAEKNLKKHFLIDDDRIIIISSEKDSQIEDLFSVEDFNNLILNGIDKKKFFKY